MENLLEGEKARWPSIALKYPWIFSTWFDNCSIKRASVKTKEKMDSDSSKRITAFKPFWDYDMRAEDEILSLNVTLFKRFYWFSHIDYTDLKPHF